MSATESTRPAIPAQNGDRGAAVSNLVVKLFSEYTGRGPTKARTHISGEVITVLLQDTLTKGERSLVRSGKDELVQSTRFAFQQTMEEELVRGVEQIMGQKVIAFMSANHLEPDMAAEVFVLAPTVEPSASEAGAGRD